MLFLIIGISVTILLTSCAKEDVEFGMKVDLVYENQTDSLVKFEILEDIGSNKTTTVELFPYSISEIFSYEYDGVQKHVEPENCCDSFLENVYSSLEFDGVSKKIILNDTLCITHYNNKSTLIENYNSMIIADRHFRYSYLFTRKDFVNAVKCD
jgi:hypothetical protein